MYALFDESAVLLIDDAGSLKLIVPSSLHQPVGVRLRGVNQIDILDGESSTLILVNDRGEEQSVIRIPFHHRIDKGTYLEGVWVLVGTDSAGLTKVAIADSAGRLVELDQSCTPANPVTPFVLAGNVVLVSAEAPFSTTSVSPAGTNCQTLSWELPAFAVPQPQLRIAAATPLGDWVLLLVVDRSSEFREFILFDQTGKILDHTPAARVGLLLSRPDGRALGYRQLPFPELVMYRYTLNPAPR